MKTSRLLQAGLILAGLLLNISALQLTAAPAKENMLIDFTYYKQERSGEIIKPYEYDFEDWEKHVTTIPNRGTLVQASTGKGGLGENKPTMDIDKTSTVELVLVIGNANKATSINFSLEDKDGTEQQWNISFAGLNKGQQYRIPLDLTKCSQEVKPGKTPGMNFKKLQAWQIKGDYSIPNVEVLLIKLVAPPK